MRLNVCLQVMLFGSLGLVQPAGATPLLLNFQGVTGAGSSFNGAPIAPGTIFEIQTPFNSEAMLSSIPGVAVSSTSVPVSLYPYPKITVGGTQYTALPNVADGSIQYAVILVDGTNTFFPGQFSPMLAAGWAADHPGMEYFDPEFASATTPGWSALSPTPTEFDGYLGSFYNSLTIPTADGALVLDYDLELGVSASITDASATPEPASISFLVLGLLAIFLFKRFAPKGLN